MNGTTNLKQNYEYLIARALKTDDGRLALATLMIQPIRKALDYLGIARKILQVDYIPDGVFPVYEKDIDAVAFKIPGKGELPTPQVEGDQVAVETFIIGVNPEISRQVLRKRRFNVINRIQARARATMQEVEDKYLFDLLEASATAYTAPTFSGGITKDPLATAYMDMRDIDVIATKFISKPSFVKSFLTWDHSDFDPITQHQVLKTGLFGKLWGMDVYLTKKASATKAYMVSEPEFLGVIPIRQDVDVLDSPNNRELKLGWSIYEEIGFSVLNTQGVNTIVKV